MKASDFRNALDKLIEEHGDLEVKGDFHVAAIKTHRLGPATVVLGSTTNYATPRPYLVTKHFNVGHVDFNKEQSK